jgi:hypothetical protein
MGHHMFEPEQQECHGSLEVDSLQPEISAWLCAEPALGKLISLGISLCAL